MTTSRFDQFWALLPPMLADGGRVLFIDEHTDELEKESYTADGSEIERTLLDGSPFPIVTNFVDPGQLTTRLVQLGWRCWIHRDGSDWVRGEARSQQ